jgi:hypothetical protein
MSSMILSGLVYSLRYVQLDRFIEKPFQIGIFCIFSTKTAYYCRFATVSYSLASTSWKLSFGSLLVHTAMNIFYIAH